MTVENGLWAYLARNAIFQTVTICQKCVLNLSNFILYCLTVASMTPQYSSAKQRKDLWQKYTFIVMQTVVFYYVFYCSHVWMLAACVLMQFCSCQEKGRKAHKSFKIRKCFSLKKSICTHSKLKCILCKIPHSPSLFLSIYLPVVCYLC